MSKTTSRWLLIDWLRCLAIVCMVIYHSFFIANHFEIINNIPQSRWYELLGNIARYLFIGLVGLSHTLSQSSTKKRLNRIDQIATAAIIITIGSLIIFDPNYYVQFGILHFITVASLILLIIPQSKTSLTICLLISIGLWQTTKTISTPPSLLYNILGYSQPFSPDHFALLNWLPIIFIGNLCGLVVKNRNTKTTKLTSIHKTIIWISKQALPIYIIHIPLLGILFYLLSLFL